jgi:hypothetical protein
MGTYRLEYGGKNHEVSGINLKNAVESLGFKVLEIEPQWRRRSNGKYIVICDGDLKIYATWLEKIEQLENQN